MNSSLIVRLAEQVTQGLDNSQPTGGRGPCCPAVFWLAVGRPAHENGTHCSITAKHEQSEKGCFILFWHFFEVVAYWFQHLNSCLTVFTHEKNCAQSLWRKGSNGAKVFSSLKDSITATAPPPPRHLSYYRFVIHSTPSLRAGVERRYIVPYRQLIMSFIDLWFLSSSSHSEHLLWGEKYQARWWWQCSEISSWSH